MTVSAEQVRLDLPSLLARVRSGETITIEENGEPVGLLSPVSRPLPKQPRLPRLGFLAGQGKVPDNWKEIGREEIEREFYGEE